MQTSRSRIAAAANAFGSAIASEPIPETGTAELRRTARAFNAMQARIQGYLVDRERLFIGISHSLKTPIMRLKLRTEMVQRQAYVSSIDAVTPRLEAADLVLQRLTDIANTIHQALPGVF